jgi:hypoxanthine phosphoribosyltransferase
MDFQNDIAEVLVSEKEIQAKVAELGQRISDDYKGQELLLIGLLRGAIVFLSDLMRAITIPARLDFIGIQSYGASTESGAGKTLSYLVGTLKARHPASLRVCALLDKPDRRQVPIRVDYVGFEIPDKFVVGYGLDFAEGYRTLPFVGVLKEHLYKEVLMRGAILEQINSYLNRETTLAQLVTWANDLLTAGELSPDDESLLRDLVAGAGDPDGESFGLTMEEWSELLGRLGQELRVSTGPLVG